MALDTELPDDVAKAEAAHPSKQPAAKAKAKKARRKKVRALHPVRWQDGGARTAIASMLRRQDILSGRRYSNRGSWHRHRPPGLGSSNLR